MKQDSQTGVKLSIICLHQPQPATKLNMKQYFMWSVTYQSSILQNMTRYHRPDPSTVLEKIGWLQYFRNTNLIEPRVWMISAFIVTMVICC